MPEHVILQLMSCSCLLSFSQGRGLLRMRSCSEGHRPRVRWRARGEGLWGATAAAGCCVCAVLDLQQRVQHDVALAMSCCSHLPSQFANHPAPIQVRRAARDELRKGAHCIKVMASGGVASPTDRCGVLASACQLRCPAAAGRCGVARRGLLRREAQGAPFALAQTEGPRQHRLLRCLNTITFQADQHPVCPGGAASDCRGGRGVRHLRLR